MFRELTIHSFRTFRLLHVGGLTRVNLFVGANNAGKTSLLDAVEILTSGDPSALWRSPARRAEELYQVAPEDRFASGVELDVSHLFFGHELERGAFFSITGLGKEKRHVECQVVDIEVSADEPQMQMQTGLPLVESARPLLALSFQSERPPSRGIIRLSPPGGVSADVRRRYMASPPDSVPPVSFLRPEIEVGRLANLWDRLVLTPEEGTVVEALRIIEPRIERLAFLGEGRRARGIFVKLKDSEHRIPLGSMGDGLKRLLALALNLVPARGGCLLVDEIDTGLHYSVMGHMWRLVVEVAERLDVQVFATTHSLDCVRALAWLRQRSAPKSPDITLHRLERDSSRTIRYTLEELETAARQHLEVR